MIPKYGAEFWKRTALLVAVAAGATFFAQMAAAGLDWISIEVVKAAGISAGAATFSTIAALIGGAVGQSGTPSPLANDGPVPLPPAYRNDGSEATASVYGSPTSSPRV